MNCDQARRILRENETPGPRPGGLMAAEEHLSRCGDCRAWSNAEREWRAAMQEKLPGAEAPRELKERLFAALAQTRVGIEVRHSRRSRIASVSAVAVVALVLAAVWWLRSPGNDRLFVNALAEDHLVYASRAQPAEFESGSPKAVTTWLSRQLSFAVNVPEFEGAELLGGRLCTLVDRRLALCFYERKGRRLSLFQVPADGLPLGSMRAVNAFGREYRCSEGKGVGVVVWKEREVLFALVSDLPERELFELASLARSP